MLNELKRHLETAGVHKGLEALGMCILQANSLLWMHHNPGESEPEEERAALLGSLTRDLESELKPLRDLAVDPDAINDMKTTEGQGRGNEYEYQRYQCSRGAGTGTYGGEKGVHPERDGF